MQEGYIINEETILPFSDSSMAGAYSSMFFEHLNDETASNLLSEINRVLIKGAVFRIVLPDFELYCKKYEQKDYDFFYDQNQDDLKTWERYSVPTDLEHLFVSKICAFHNLPHTTVASPWAEDLESSPPKVYVHSQGWQLRLKDFYCGPAPELTTELIQEKFKALSRSDFIKWVLSASNESKYSDQSFNSWHKNYWSFDKIYDFAMSHGFSCVNKMSFEKRSLRLNDSIEKTGHKNIGIYFEMIK